MEHALTSSGAWVLLRLTDDVLILLILPIHLTDEKLLAYVTGRTFFISQCSFCDIGRTETAVPLAISPLSKSSRCTTVGGGVGEHRCWKFTWSWSCLTKQTFFHAPPLLHPSLHKAWHTLHDPEVHYLANVSPSCVSLRSKKVWVGSPLVWPTPERPSPDSLPRWPRVADWIQC